MKFRRLSETDVQIEQIETFTQLSSTSIILDKNQSFSFQLGGESFTYIREAQQSI